MQRIPFPLFMILLLTMSACADDAPPTPTALPVGVTAQGIHFVEDRAYRRLILERSVVLESNGYSSLRLKNYGVEGGWDELPVWNPPSRPIMVDDVATFDGSSPTQGVYLSMELEPWSWEHDDLMRVGARAFESFPLDVDLFIGQGVQSMDAVERYGLWIDARQRVGGALRVRTDTMGRPEEAFALTCSTCHASTNAQAQLVHGMSNARFDQGALRAIRSPGSASWGPGLVDVTPDGQNNPAAIIDLRPIRHQKRLHWAATLHNSLPALAVRIDTLLITGLSRRARPPRKISWALAYYLWHLSESQPAAAKPLSAQASRGQEHFQAQCAGCHHEDGTTGAPIDLASIGTDPAVGESTQRGTGTYRIPSLWKVGTRTQWMHHGRVRTLEDMFTPERLQRTPGHPFGTTLDAQGREDLVVFLETLDDPQQDAE